MEEPTMIDLMEEAAYWRGRLREAEAQGEGTRLFKRALGQITLAMVAREESCPCDYHREGRPAYQGEA